MNQSDINGFLLCLSRMTMTDNDRDHLLYQHLNNSYSGAGRGDTLSLFGNSYKDQDHHNHDLDHQHDHNHSNNNDFHEIVMAKATAMFVLFCATTICGATPFLINRYLKGKSNNANARSATVVKCLLYFGGGVLLCTTFLHLLPEVREAVEGLQKCGTFPAISFPFVELLMCVGFFLMFLIEELIHTYVHKNKNILDKETAAFERGHSVRHSHLMRNVEKCRDDIDTDCPNTNENSCGTIKTLSPRDLYASDMENPKHQHNDHQRIRQAPSAPAACTEANTHTQSPSHDAGYSHYHSHNHYHQHHSHLPLKANGSQEDMLASSLRGLLIVLALSVHELFEGLAIGLESSASNVWFMFGAVSAHKLVLSFCVGVELIVARTRTYLSILFVFTFAVVSPIGIGIGMLVSSHNTAAASSIPSAILQGLACGTLLYVVFFEILSKDRSGLLAYMVLIIGFGMMFGLQQLFSGHQHNHGGCLHSEDSHSYTSSRNQHDHKSLASAEAQKHSLEKQLQILREASTSLKHILNKN